MRWSDERYVKLYTRDTADWLCLSWRAQGLMCLLMRKCDGAGLIFLGRRGKKAVATLLGTGWCPEIETALDELLEDGCVRLEEPYLVLPNFIEAQEAKASNALRKQHERETAKARVVASARAEIAKPAESLNVDVTRSHAESRDVTPRPTQPISAQPSPAQQNETAASGLEVSGKGSPPTPPAPSGPLYPETARMRLVLSERLARPPNSIPGPRSPDEADELERRVAKVGADRVAEWAAQKAKDRGISLRGLGLVLTWLRDGDQKPAEAPKPKRAPGENPKPGDPDYDRPDSWWSLAAFNARPRRDAA